MLQLTIDGIGLYTLTKNSTFPIESHIRAGRVTAVTTKRKLRELREPGRTGLEGPPAGRVTCNLCFAAPRRATSSLANPKRHGFRSPEATIIRGSLSLAHSRFSLNAACKQRRFLNRVTLSTFGLLLFLLPFEKFLRKAVGRNRLRHDCAVIFLI